MAEKEMKINIRTGSDPSGVQSAIKELEALRDRVAGIREGTAEAGVNISKAGDEIEKAGRKGADFGTSLLQASYAVEDLQYGVRGVLNNIPQLTMALGMGAGATGVISLLLVGLTTAAEKFGLMGGAAEKATEDLRKAAEESAKVARDAVRDAEEMGGAERGWQAFTDRINAAQKAYTALAKSIDDAAAARRREAEELEAIRNAEDRAAEAEIDAQLAAGEISPQDAARGKSGIAAAARARQRAAQREGAEQQRRDALQRAEYFDREASAAEFTRSTAERYGAGLMTERDFKATQARLNAERDQYRIRAAEVREAFEALDAAKRLEGRTSYKVDVETPAARLAERQEAANAVGRKVAELSELVAAHQAAFRAISVRRGAGQPALAPGVSDLNDLSDWLDSQKDGIESLRKAAEDARATAEALKITEERRAQAFEHSERAESLRAESRIVTMDRRDAEKLAAEREREADKLRKEAERMAAQEDAMWGIRPGMSEETARRRMMARDASRAAMAESGAGEVTAAGQSLERTIISGISASAEDNRRLARILREMDQRIQTALEREKGNRE